ncbi:MAG: hypothetical protein RL563_341 [Pseudomonadota bacterium]|jgi:hypothetical protein
MKLPDMEGLKVQYDLKSGNFEIGKALFKSFGAFFRVNRGALMMITKISCTPIGWLKIQLPESEGLPE